MVQDPRVSQQLARLGGLYRDPARVDRDASSLLRSGMGENLAPITAEMVENNGDTATVLVLQGTIELHFRGNSYQQLVDMYLPPGYPRVPPNCFVRLADNMYLKENHRHVGSDGKVYLPYLHEWQQHTHNLIELVVAMSSVFSADPPVFTRAAAPAPPPPPSVSTAASLPPPPAYSASFPDNEQRIAREVAEANAAAEAARRAEQEEREREEQLKAQKAWESAKQKQVKAKVQEKVIQYIQQASRQAQEEAQAARNEERQLAAAKDKRIAQMKFLEQKKSELTKANETLDTKIKAIRHWLDDQKEKESKAETLSAEDQVRPVNALHQQMLELGAKNAALGDALYFLDRALYKGNIDCQSHLKQVRQVAKKQFLARAHLIKIQQTMLDQSN